MTKRLRATISLAALVAVAATLAAPFPATATSAEPTIITQAWYWKEQTSQEVKDPQGNTYNIEAPNPFCPAPPGDIGAIEQACAKGRLPVEIDGGDYTQPDKFSAVTFDFSLVPVGSTIKKFTVSFLEAKAGCYDENGDGQPDECEQTDPVNLGTHELQACLVGQVFGAGSARPVNESPKYKCSSTDPTATRKAVKPKPTGDTTPSTDSKDHVWTFDLTSYAQKWVKKFSLNTSIVINGLPPKGYDPKNPDGSDNWRVVLAGPATKNGVASTLAYTAPKTPPTTGGGSTGTTGGSTGTTTTTTGVPGSSGTVGSIGGTSSSGLGGGSSGTVGGGSGSVPSPAPTGAPAAASAPAPAPQGIPGYVWLAILAGIVGFVLVRSVVIESTGGPRPNGVLAQIRALNAQRQGRAAPDATAAPKGAVASVAGALRSAVSKIRPKRGS